MLNSSIVGCGAISRLHASAVSSLDIANLISVADVKYDKAQKLASDFGGKPFANLESMLEEFRPDVLHVCTPHYTHSSLAINALGKGVNVLLEKPPAITLEELPLISEAEKTSGKLLGVCFQHRFKNTALKAKELIDSGDSGAVKGARGFVTWKRGEKYYTESGWRGSLKTEGGGVMINQAIHNLDLMLWLVGNPLTIEGSICNRHLEGIIEVEDTAEAYLDFGKGVKGVFYATTAYSSDPSAFLEIDCENYTLRIEDEYLFVRDHSGHVTTLFSNTYIPAQGKVCWGSYHETLISDFYACVENHREFRIGISEGSRALKALLCLYEASAGKSRVSYL
jgi:UDP-N-acetyl-2-amino-2-deoxyglucuronate dehydrogenase